MGASELPTDLVRARSRFEAWPKLRENRCRISQWQLGVRLARSYGIHRTATALKLDFFAA